MGRCGCSSAGASGAAISDTDCISVTGAGTSASPFALEPIINPAANNLLECGANGLFVPDPDDPGEWTPYTPTWQSASYPQPIPLPGALVGLYRARGHSIEFAIELAIGDGTVPGTGFWTFGLPPGYPCAIGTAVSGLATVVADGQNYPCSGVIGAGGTALVLFAATSGGGAAIGSPAPGGSGYGGGSHIYIGGVYPSS